MSTIKEKVIDILVKLSRFPEIPRNPKRGKWYKLPLPGCVTEIRMGNSALLMSGFFKQGSTETAADKMAKVLQAEAAIQKQ